MKKTQGKNKSSWTKEKIEEFVEMHDGDALYLLDKFPYSTINIEKINAAYADEDKYTDSEFCDYLIELAIEQVESCM